METAATTVWNVDINFHIVRNTLWGSILMYILLLAHFVCLEIKVKDFRTEKEMKNFTRVLKETLHREWPREKYNMWR